MAAGLPQQWVADSRGQAKQAKHAKQAKQAKRARIEPPTRIEVRRVQGPLRTEAQALQAAGHAAQDGRQLSRLSAQQDHHAEQLAQGAQVQVCTSRRQ